MTLFYNSLEELWDIIKNNEEAPKPDRGRMRLREALEVLGMEYLLIPKNQEGVYELAIICNWRYRERITELLDCKFRCVLNRWDLKIQAFKSEKSEYETILKRNLDQIDEDFTMLGDM